MQQKNFYWGEEKCLKGFLKLIHVFGKTVFMDKSILVTLWQAIFKYFCWSQKKIRFIIKSARMFVLLHNFSQYCHLIIIWACIQQKKVFITPRVPRVSSHGIPTSCHCLPNQHLRLERLSWQTAGSLPFGSPSVQQPTGPRGAAENGWDKASLPQVWMPIWMLAASMRNNALCRERAGANDPCSGEHLNRGLTLSLFRLALMSQFKCCAE